MIEDNNKQQKKKGFFSRLVVIDWVALIALIASIIAYIFFYILKPGFFNILTNQLFLFVQLFLGIYITARITSIAVTDKNIEVQKGIAKTAIRRIRDSKSATLNLMGIVERKIPLFIKNNRMTDTLDEVKGHLSNLISSISSSESDFKAILGEEFIEENLRFRKIDEDLSLLIKIYKEEKELSQKKEAAAKKRIMELEKEKKEIEERISAQLVQLPITASATSLIVDPFMGTKAALDSFGFKPMLTNEEWLRLGMFKSALDSRNKEQKENNNKKTTKKKKNNSKKDIIKS